MSLQLAAKHLAAQGRGPDKNLVHMSPREVAGLQALAMAGGGSLSVNPQTGLYEAGFLDKMLPMLIGVGITAATGGAATPMMLGLGMGGFEAARTGSLSKGLMAGLGAYGGAGLGAGLMGAGAETLGATANAMGVPAATGAGSQAAMLAAQNQGFGQAGLEALGRSAATAPGAFTGFVKTPVQSMTSGAMGLTEAPGRTAFMNAIGGGKEALKFGAAAAAPMLLNQEKFTPPAPDTERYNYSFDPGRVGDPQAGYMGPPSGERDYFDPRFTRRYAEGGPVEQMSASNIFDMQNARGGVSDMGIDSFTGMERMAEGGVAAAPDAADIIRRFDLQGMGSGGEQGTMVGGRIGYAQPLDAQTMLKLGLMGHYAKGQGFKNAGADAADIALQRQLDKDSSLQFSMGAGKGKGVNRANLSYNRRFAEGGSANDYSGNAYAFAPVAQAAPSPGRRRVAAAPVEDPEVRTQLDNLERQELISQGYRGEDALPTANRSMPVEQPYVPPVAAGEYTYEYDPATQTYKNIAPPPGTVTQQPAAEEIDPYFGSLASTGFAGGGITDLGGYSDGGRLLRGPGDGVSDSIPAMIGQKQPARLADGEFVVPARIVSELGNGSTEAGARKLYAMMDRVQSARRNTVGKNKVANNPRADKFLPA